ncbi:uncharacterized protein LOC126560071 [Anopheles maculipalpis]|uniref:uncharacterized protein LOC126560071 n=1 Tax=Anopheles maculipalpis TaxID=1496333 RepID=UPI002158C797|nr:uncharacterized protein LOC126560071 [Anopheles maculipalpis]
MDDSDTPTYSETKLIELIKRQPAVWNKHDSLYKNKVAERTVWKEISNLLETDVTHLKKRWHSLRGQYRRELRLPRSSKWKHFQRLSFLSESMSPINGSPHFRADDDEDDPIRIERPQTKAPLVILPKEEPFEWACASTTSPQKTAAVAAAAPSPPVQAAPPDLSNEGNYYFALSLVGILNSIPKRQELSARLAVLNALRDFQQPRAEECLQSQQEDRKQV